MKLFKNIFRNIFLFETRKLSRNAKSDLLKLVKSENSYLIPGKNIFHLLASVHPISNIIRIRVSDVHREERCKHFAPGGRNDRGTAVNKTCGLTIKLTCKLPFKYSLIQSSAHLELRLRLKRNELKNDI